MFVFGLHLKRNKQLEGWDLSQVESAKKGIIRSLYLTPLLLTGSRALPRIRQNGGMENFIRQ